MKVRFLVFLLVPLALLAQTPQPRPESFEWDHQIALFDEAYDRENFVEAEGYARKSLAIVDQLHLSDEQRATSIAGMAEALRYQKKYSEAEPLYRQALALREKVLPSNHPRIAMTSEGLAFTLVGLNRPDEAEPLYLRALSIWDRASQDDENPCRHGKVLDGLGRLYLRQSKYDKAEPLFQRALSIWAQAQTPCTVVVPAMNDLSQLYVARGETAKAEIMYQRTIPLLQKELGDEQPELVAKQQVKLALLYMSEKKFSEAVGVLQPAVSVLQNRQPSDRETLKLALTTERSALLQLHRDISSLDAQLEAIEGVQSQSLEPLARWQGLMGMVRFATTNDQRITLLQQALAAAEKLPPGEQLSQTLIQLAAFSTGAQTGQAEGYYKRALANNEKVFGENSKQVAEVLEALAGLYEGTQRPEAAEPLRVRAVSIREKVGPPVFLSSSLENLGRVYLLQKKFPQAESQYLRALETLQKERNRDQSFLEEDLGRLYLQWEKYQQSSEHFARVLQIQEAQLGPTSTRLLPTLEILSDLMNKLGHPDEAQQYDGRRKKIIDEQIARGNTPSPAK